MLTKENSSENQTAEPEAADAAGSVVTIDAGNVSPLVAELTAEVDRLNGQAAEQEAQLAALQTAHAKTVAGYEKKP
eukprot:SAG31_NODE_22345_length_527_cov_1.441589_1_plen_76_part_00